MKLLFFSFALQGLIATLREPLMADLNYREAFNLAYSYAQNIDHSFRKKSLVHFAMIEKAKKAALRHHNASKDDHEEFKRVLHSPNKNRITYIKELIRNPTVQTEQVMEDLSKIVVNGEIWIIKEFINNTNIDLSFGGNRLLELAMEKMNTAMIKLLLTDRRVKDYYKSENSNTEDDHVSKNVDLPADNRSASDRYLENSLASTEESRLLDQDKKKERVVITQEDNETPPVDRDHEEWVAINDPDKEDEEKKKPAARFWNRFTYRQRISRE